MLPGFSSRFECKVSGQKESLTVLDFEFEVSLSQLYVCKIELVSTNPNLDYWSFVDKNATLTVNVKGANALQYVNGIVTKFFQKGKVGKGYSYELVLEPHLSQTKHQEKTEVFLNETIPSIIESHLKQAKIQHYRMDLSQTYNPRDFVCQFQETDFNFISRWMEHEGIYYYFEQGTDFETLVLTDRYSTHKDHDHFSELKYNQENITGISESNYVVENFICEISKVARTLELKGYNYNDDTKTIVTEVEVSSHGMGIVEIYDENVLNEKDAKRIAEIRAQEINCKEQIYTGTTLASNIVPGYRFKLVNHFRDACNQEYLVFDAIQKGSQRQVALSHLGLQDSRSEENEVVFTTEFKVIPGNIQYRAPLVTSAKRIDGIIPAMLDAETSGEYAQLDDQGRYKVRLLHSDKPDGQASDWVRKMESYIGDQYGNHFPMHKNSEICLAFQFGNPDRPIIIGAVHNSSNKNLVTSKNQKRSITRSASGNVYVMGDEKGQEYTHLYSPSGNVSLVMGDVKAASDNSTDGDQTEIMDWPSNWTALSWGLFPTPGDNLREKKTVGGDSASNTQGNSFSYTNGNSCGVTIGFKNSFTYGNSFSVTVGNSNSITLAGSESLTVGPVKMSSTITGVELSHSFTALKASYSKTFKEYKWNSGTFTRAALLGISNSVEAGGISNEVTAGGMTNKVIAGGISNTVTAGDYTTTATAGNIASTATAGNISETADAGNITSTATLGGISLSAPVGAISGTSDTITLTATTSITLTCGASSIEITPAGVTITNGGSSISNAPEGVVIKSGSAILSLDAAAGALTGTGSMVNIGP
ncbi:type VI secretion system tip protein VgrG [Francisellaceae bacterium]|nr:type VI secretion system tip protein VgrG [Francisellaceae bacterium]